MLLMSLFLLARSGAGCMDRAEVESIADGRVLYVEERVRIPCHGRRERDSVRYLRPDGTLLGSKVVAWRADQRVPEFDLRMDSPLKRVSAKWKGDIAKIELERSTGTGSYEVPVPAGTVLDAGIDVWIVDNLPRLAQGASLEVPLLVPEFHRVIWFSARAVVDGVNRPNRIAIELKPRNWFIQALSTPLVAGYDRETGALTDFKGVSDLKGLDGKNFKVRMRYRGWQPVL